MVPVPTKSNFLYVWVPYTCFLIVVFIILAVSFVKHIKRVLKRRRVVMDYIEAEVLSKRPRIGRMYSSPPDDAHNTFRFEGTSSDCHVRNCGYRHLPVSASGLRGEAHPPHLVENRTTPRSVRSLRMPAVMDPSIYRHKMNGLEDSGQSLWFKDRLMYGYNNFAFSFDEDLGRSHTRRVLSSPRSPLPRGMHGREDVTLGHGYAPSMAVIDSEQESQHSSTSNDNTTAARLQSVTADINDSQGREHSPAEYVNNGETSSSLKPPPPPPPPPPHPLLLLHQSHQGQESHFYGAEGHPRICSYCGSVLADPVVVNGSQSSGTRPKKKPRYRRQSACTDMNSASEFSAKSAALQGSPQHLHTSPPQGASERDASVSNTPSTVSEAARSSSVPSENSASVTSHRQREGEEMRTAASVHAKDRHWRGLRSLQRSNSQRSGAEQLAMGLEVFTIERRHSSGEPFLPCPSELTDQRRTTTTANQLKRTPSASLPSYNCRHLSPTTSPSLNRKSPLHLQSYLCVPDLAQMSSSTPSSSSSTTATAISLHGLGRSFPSDSASSAGEEKDLSSAEDRSIFWLSGRCTDTEQTLV